MPLAAPIGSNKGLVTREFIQILIDEIDAPIIVDAGIGSPAQACEAMQMGQSYISTEHLLLGIVREGEGTALEGRVREVVAQEEAEEAQERAHGARREPRVRGAGTDRGRVGELVEERGGRGGEADDGLGRARRMLNAEC